MAAGNAAGKPLSNTSSAAGPPAEDPIATNPRRWEASRSGAATDLDLVITRGPNGTGPVVGNSGGTQANELVALEAGQVILDGAVWSAAGGSERQHYRARITLTLSALTFTAAHAQDVVLEAALGSSKITSGSACMARIRVAMLSLA